MVKFRVNFGIFVNISRSSVSYSSNGISRILKKASLSKFVILTFAAKMSLLNDIAGTVGGDIKFCQNIFPGAN